MRDVYDHYRGHGSWKLKVRNEQQGILIFGSILAVVLPILLGRICNIYGLVKPLGFLNSIIAVTVSALACFILLGSLPPMTYDGTLSTGKYTLPGLAESALQLIVSALVFVIQPLSALLCIGHLWLFPDSWHGRVEHAIYASAFYLFLEIAILQLAVALTYLFSKDK